MLPPLLPHAAAAAVAVAVAVAAVVAAAAAVIILRGMVDSVDRGAALAASRRHINLAEDLVETLSKLRE